MLQTCLRSERLADQNAEETPASFANYCVGMLDMASRTLRASLSGTFLQKEGCRKPVLGVWARRWLLLGLCMWFGWGLAPGASYEEVGPITTHGLGGPNVRPWPCGRTLAARPVLTLCLGGWVVSCGLSGGPCPLSSCTDEAVCLPLL